MNFWSRLAVPQQVGGAVDVDGLGELRLLLARRVADDRREVDDRLDAVERRLRGGRVGHVAADQLEEAVRAAGQEAVAAELERVEHADPVSLLQQHRDERRADVTGSAGDENSHRGLHPWWLECAWNVEVLSVNRAARRDGQVNTPGPRPCGLPLRRSRRQSIVRLRGPALTRPGCPVRATLSPSPAGLSTSFWPLARAGQESYNRVSSWSDRRIDRSLSLGDGTMHVVAEKTYTPEDLLSMPDGKRLRAGRRPPRGAEYEPVVELGRRSDSSRIHDVFLRANTTSAGPGRPISAMTVYPDSPKKVRKPDVSYIRIERMPEGPTSEGYAHIPPDLAVEVVSPNDLLARSQGQGQRISRSGRAAGLGHRPRSRGRVHVYRHDGTVSLAARRRMSSRVKTSSPGSAARWRRSSP